MFNNHLGAALPVSLVAFLFVITGCGDAAMEFGRSTSPAGNDHLERIDNTASESAPGDTELNNVSLQEPPAVSRKIIYTATIALVVEDFAATQKQMEALVKQHEGYVAEFREDRRYGDQLAGRWVVRIPVSQFEQFVASVVELGVPESREINAQDVTEQFIDLSARLSNKKRLEERMLKLLEDRTGEIKDVIEVESQLGRVREEIEVMEGKLRYLTDRIAMTTVTISAREERDYTPPQAPTFGVKIHRTFADSLLALRRFGETLVLLIVAATPWLVVGCVLLIPVGIWWKRRRRKV
jgi:uncharacterized coiled-coil protein SlyX